ncbi:cobyrinic acid a,c-diamide synthase [Desulfohalotomaculum tongense]|uniref:cobyrinate a,c-diamide synthase n=1 Tax=Desulforadius tongensis TaxID=1216062 RepID=UPI00195E0EB9|nr:cobyrinate a,c-diamide synthase [Desulforadius tongensis]MBM7854346.1 cobyrinic acid a,c-diamide synthase [Desulforadius tongensis]
MYIPRFVVAGTHSGVGKTTVSLGLMAALRRRGLSVQPFKVGPDYIDPGLHRVAAGCYSHNLDSWLCPEPELKTTFARYCAGAQVAVVEGVMGLYDGMRYQGELASTAQISKITGTPVVLVVSARGVGRSLAAMVKGYLEFDPKVNMIGVVVNQAGSRSHAELLRHSIEEELGVPVLGVLARHGQLEIPGRHLGLMPASEMPGLPGRLEQLAGIVDEEIDIDRLLSLAGKAPPLDCELPGCDPVVRDVTIAVAMDEAFNFYYQDSLHYLKELGAGLVYFSPLNDTALPQPVNGIILGGGFPEVFLPRLSANRAMRTELKSMARRGVPIYAECGGFMYLCSDIYGMDGISYPGVGLVPGTVKMQNSLSALGYVTGKLQKNCLLGRAGDLIKGHEFHWSTVSGLSPGHAAYSLQGGRGQDGRRDGYTLGNLFASYVHIHWRGNPGAARNFLLACAKYKAGGR